MDSVIFLIPLFVILLCEMFSSSNVLLFLRPSLIVTAPLSDKVLFDKSSLCSALTSKIGLTPSLVMFFNFSDCNLVLFCKLSFISLT